jgi:hypothetical protein
MIPRNVCQAVEAPQARRGGVRALSREETHRLVEAAWAQQNPYGEVVILAVHTGLRLGSCWACRGETSIWSGGC